MNLKRFSFFGGGVMRWLLMFVMLLLSALCVAMPADGLVYKLKASVVKVRVILPNGNYGVGSGVVVDKDQVVTNCHVVANAAAINVIKFGESYRASAIKADWVHDLCIVKFDGFDVPVVTMGASQSLQYEQPVFSISFPNNAPKPQSTYGNVKALYPMDDSVVIRATSDFRLGASGGPLFDDEGRLVGIITLKSPGRNAFYYNMPVEWIANLLKQPEVSIPAKGDLPFWDAPEEKRPFFMRVIQPYQTENWQALLEIASLWCEKEPSTLEALFYKAVAEYHLKDSSNALKHFKQVVAQNSRHVGAQLHLGLMAAQAGQKDDALKQVALLGELDVEAATEINAALGIPPVKNE